MDTTTTTTAPGGTKRAAHSRVSRLVAALDEVGVPLHLATVGALREHESDLRGAVALAGSDRAAAEAIVQRIARAL